ncbi:hypothetical protein [Komagataeibacter diospyri]|uniref:hypothetical protein n=1 Tax=Komagataeibacter diospyri TaxID=1932662 RepID=UPI003757781E
MPDRTITFFLIVLLATMAGCQQPPDHTDKCWRAPSSRNSSLHGSITTGFGVGSGRGMTGGFPMGGSGMTGAGGMPGPVPTGMEPAMDDGSPFVGEQTSRPGLPKDCMPPDFPTRVQGPSHQTARPQALPAAWQASDTVDVSGIRIGP